VKVLTNLFWALLSGCVDANQKLCGFLVVFVSRHDDAFEGSDGNEVDFVVRRA